MEGKMQKQHEDMQHVIQQKNNLTAMMETSERMNDRNKRAAEKISNLEKTIQDQKEKIDSLEKTRSKMMQEKNELEDKEFNLENRLKQKEARFIALEE